MDDYSDDYLDSEDLDKPVRDSYKAPSSKASMGQTDPNKKSVHWKDPSQNKDLKKELASKSSTKPSDQVKYEDLPNSLKKER